MWSFPVVVFDEFPVEREPHMFEVVGSEPSFDLSKRGGFAYSIPPRICLIPCCWQYAVKLDSLLFVRSRIDCHGL